MCPKLRKKKLRKKRREREEREKRELFFSFSFFGSEVFGVGMARASVNNMERKVGEEGSGLEFKLHPLVIINISDHYTRCSYNVKEGGRVIGCLLGEQKGRVIHITNTFEMNFKADSEEQNVDQEHLNFKKQQYKTVFPKLEVIGWYSTGDKIQENDLQTHKTISEINESPVFLLLDPTISAANRDLPIKLYETEMHVIEGIPSQIFVQAKYTVDSLEAERIAVDQVARIVPSGKASSTEQLSSHMTGMQNAIKMLRMRISTILGVVKQMKEGKIPYDHGLLREISSLVRRLPVGTDKTKKGLNLEYNDTLLITYLSVMTSGNATLHELVNKINATYDQRVSHRRTLF